MKKIIILILIFITLIYLFKNDSYKINELFKSNRRNEQESRRDMGASKSSRKNKNCVNPSLGAFYHKIDKTWHLGYFDIFSLKIKSFSIGF